jgi:hypothetical protein
MRKLGHGKSFQVDDLADCMIDAGLGAAPSLAQGRARPAGLPRRLNRA